MGRNPSIIFYTQSVLDRVWKLPSLKVFKQGSLLRTSQHFKFANMHCRSLREGVDGAFPSYLTADF